MKGNINIDLIFVHLTPLCAALIVSHDEAPSTLIVIQLLSLESNLGRNSRATFLNAKVGQYHK